MSERAICHGCGQRVDIPEGYRRTKLQCPECGVIFPIEVADRKPAAAENSDSLPFEARPSSASTPSADSFVEPDITSLPDLGPSRTQAEASTESTVWTCENCGEWQPKRPRGKKARCPVCKTAVAQPTKNRAAKATLLESGAPRLAVVQDEWSVDDDGKPYRVDAKEAPICPGCGKKMAPDDVLCLHCGLDLRSGEKAKTVYKAISKEWDAGLPLPRRWQIFALWQCIAIPSMIFGTRFEGHGIYAVIIWMWLSFMAAFLCGTFNRINLQRNPRGKVRLVKTWFAFFVPREPITIDLGKYEGILIGQVHDLDFADYLVCAALSGFFIVPGIVWYFAIMQRDTWYVALTQDHGHPEMTIYRGWREDRAKEIAATLRTAAVAEYSWYAEITPES